MGKRVLTEAQRVTIRAMHKKGISVPALSSMYGVSRGTIYFVLSPKQEQENRERNRARMREVRDGKDSHSRSSA